MAQSFSTTIGLTANASSAGQPVDFDGPAVQSLTITNSSGVDIQFTLDGSSWQTVSNGFGAALGTVSPALFKLRKSTSDSYPVPVALTWLVSDAARSVLSSTLTVIATRDLLPVTTVASSAPTVTWGTVSAASTITGGVRISPLRRNTSFIDVGRDPNFEYIGAHSGESVAVSSTDMSRAAFLTGGSGQSARFRVRPRFVFTGTKFEIYVRAVVDSTQWRLWVDGKPVSLALTSTATTSTGRYYVLVDFGSFATRVIEWEAQDAEFGGVVIEQAGSICKAPKKATLMGFGDSLTAGATGVTAHDTWLRFAAERLGMDWANMAIGGSGYFSAPAFNTRIGDVATTAPDVFVCFGSYNDLATKTSTEIAEKMRSLLTTLRAAMPNTMLIAAGPWMVSDSQQTAHDATDAAMRAVAESMGVGYISIRDPENVKGWAPTFAAGVATQVGDYCVYNGIPRVCTVAHTTTGTFDATKWRSASFVSGTGKVGATTGTGNADVVIGTDGTHPSAQGHEMLGQFMASKISNEIKRLAAVS